ncbi:GTP cyclohydrolase I, partial [Mollisia scopiformis]
QKLHTLTAAIKIMISCLGEDPTREGLLDTPQRYAKALLSFTEGYHMKVANVINNAIFHVDEGSDMVIVKDIEVFSLCEHHLVPFMGKIHVGYLPDGRVIGLSKIARIVEVFARRLQVQERLTRQVALAIEEVLKPHGVAVVMESSHLCMIMRGVQKTNSSTTTRCMLGSFNHEADLRKEFLSLLRAR